MKIGIDSVINKDAFTIQYRRGSYVPFEITGPRNETLAARETAWLGVSLCGSPVFEIWGPDAIKFLNYHCVNRDWSKLKPGASRHAIMCNEKGNMIADGVAYITEEGHYRTYWLAPMIAYYAENTDMDIQYKDVSDEEYFFQIDGPKSLEIMEKACQCDLHDLKFAHNKVVTCANSPMTIHRLGMSGCLAYEMHGSPEFAEAVYSRICEAGKEFGMVRAGIRSYCMNHSQAYVNQNFHFLFDLDNSGEGFRQYCNTHGREFQTRLGSLADMPEKYHITPYDADWGSRVNFNHEFIGKEALLKHKQECRTKVVTLIWDPDDCAQVYASQFRGKGVKPADVIDRHRDTTDGRRQELFPGMITIASKVYAGDKMIGYAANRTNDYYHREIIAVSFIDKDYAEIGTEVKILWGTPGTPQYWIRAKVAEFPYYNEELRNETFDVEKIPHPSFL